MPSCVFPRNKAGHMIANFEQQTPTAGSTESDEVPQARECEVTATTIQSLRFPILQIPPGPRGSKDWRLQGSFPRSRDPSFRDPRSRDREFLDSTGVALGLLRMASDGKRRRGSERFGKTLRQPTSLQNPRNPWMSIEINKLYGFPLI